MKVMVYNPQQETQNLSSTGGYSSWFQNAHPSDCPVTSCSLKAVGCQAVFKGFYVSMGPGKEVKVKVTEQNVFREEFCLGCTSGYQTIQYDKIVVEQVQDCSAAISKKAPQKKTYDYSGSDEVKVVAESW